MTRDRQFTPREVVSELDRYIVGQHRAKRAVAIALRNRWRRRRVPNELRDEITPKNILMIGATGVGKTEIARRLAKLAHAPFVKVEASKFTEVGYVGRDVESMIRDLVEQAIQLVRASAMESVRRDAEHNAEERLVELVARARMPKAASPRPPEAPKGMPFFFGMPPAFRDGQSEPPPASLLDTVRAQLRAGVLDDESVDVDAPDERPLLGGFLAQPGMEEMESGLREMFSQLPGVKGRTRTRTLKVPDARKLLVDVEARRLVDEERVQRDAVELTEQSGIVFLDEIDKVASRGHGQGPDVSREGVQRDLLPVVEGSTVQTKYGPVRTDHVLFIAAGAFHVAKVSDLIPELQGRFPIRVELDPLRRDDFVRILTEPKNALTRQYEVLLATERVELRFAEDAIDAIADAATRANERLENIGARRLHTILEALVEDISFTAPERGGEVVVIDAAHVARVIDPILGDDDHARYVL